MVGPAPLDPGSGRRRFYRCTRSRAVARPEIEIAASGRRADVTWTSGTTTLRASGAIAVPSGFRPRDHYIELEVLAANAAFMVFELTLDAGDRGYDRVAIDESTYARGIYFALAGGTITPLGNRVRDGLAVGPESELLAPFWTNRSAAVVDASGSVRAQTRPREWEGVTAIAPDGALGLGGPIRVGLRDLLEESVAVHVSYGAERRDRFDLRFRDAIERVCTGPVAGTILWVTALLDERALAPLRAQSFAIEAGAGEPCLRALRIDSAQLTATADGGLRGLDLTSGDEIACAPDDTLRDDVAPPHDS